MSRSQPRLTSPVTRIFEWAGGKGELTYYDHEKQARLPVELPFQFMVLDELASITGFSDKANYRIWSNEVRTDRLKNTPFIVRTKGETLYQGLYSRELGVSGAGYTASIYIAYYMKSGELAVGKIAATGSARGAWFDFSKTCNVENGKVILTGKGALQQNGAAKWYPPVFKWDHTTRQEDEIAVELDKQVQDYLERSFAAGREDDQPSAADDFGQTVPPDLAPEPMHDAEFDSLLNSGSSNDINPDDLPVSFRN